MAQRAREIRGAAEPAWRTALRYAVADGIPRRSVAVAVVVGSLLNLINQGDTLWGSAKLNWTKLALTFVVPYLVSTYGAVAYKLSLTSASRQQYTPPAKP